jgi:anti-sigma-K factor RskA
MAAAALLVWSLGPGRSTSAPQSPLSASVKGTLVAPEVQGSLTYYPQTQTAVLSVHGLRGETGGRVYEVWLVRPDNAVTPAGYLTEQPDGTWSVAMHGDMHGYSGVAATVEPSGGSRTPTGQQVLSGSLPSA